MSAVVTRPETYFAENDIRYVFLDGHSCRKLDVCFNSLQAQLSIPGYFGHNLDALEEVLNDLDWVGEKKIRIIILGASGLLRDDAEKKKAFLDILASTGNKNLEIVYLSDAASNE